MRLSESSTATALAAAAAVSGASLDTCCARLASALGDVVTTTPFTASDYFSLQESTLVPACIVRPRSAQDVSAAVAILSTSRTPGCQFAVKGGGHTPAGGSANIQGGVTIDMTSLNATVLSGDGTSVGVGAGAVWNDVYGYLGEFGLAAAGGRNGLVGVGGLLLGGGISHFSPRVGWACDGVVEHEVVLGNGTLVNVSATSHPDLYRALKGGGNNFGVVTRYELKTFPQGNMSVSTLTYDLSEIGAVFDAFTGVAADPNFDPYVSLQTGLLYASAAKTWSLSSSAGYTKPVLHPEVYSELEAVPSLSNSSEIIAVAPLAAENPTPPLNWLFATLTFGPSSEAMLDIFNALNGSLYDFNPVGGVTWNFAFEPLPSVMLSHADATGGNVLGLKPEDGNSVVLLFSALWPNSSSNDAIYQKGRDTFTAVKWAAERKGVLRKFEYLNYAGPHQSPLASYGADNLNFLRRVSKKYDPTGVFQSKVPGGFKLW
ncbi:FAD-binding domain-containing protein [Trichoderma citrinoviride]|uniref:FAD-binding domain-containing protein n=1 Tax=Trichoderma citrinoviride TaxID=58853 RepID=A0A2T4B7C6_9HYPO|nr:FAD-binding domain-containing protein [Trichoderma citrinoviride]PTB65129.1 FAD-binding domain-containing protein [Trichoderma citrinoviride]